MLKRPRAFAPGLFFSRIRLESGPVNRFQGVTVSSLYPHYTTARIMTAGQGHSDVLYRPLPHVLVSVFSCRSRPHHDDSNGKRKRRSRIHPSAPFWIVMLLEFNDEYLLRSMLHSRARRPSPRTSQEPWRR